MKTEDVIPSVIGEKCEAVEGNKILIGTISGISDNKMYISVQLDMSEYFILQKNGMNTQMFVVASPENIIIHNSK